MKPRTFIWACLFLCLGIFRPACAGDTPVAVAKEGLFRFGLVLEGTVVSHDFIIENAGDSLLIIERVKTSCGCTTADFTRQIPPGKDGSVTIKANTSGYAGRKFSKTITVCTNDPNQREMRLDISGEVEPFALIEPNRICLRGEVGKKIQSQITITPLKKYPFRIVESYAENLGKRIKFKLKNQGDSYILTVKNLMEIVGRYRGAIHLKTDSKVKPEINIYVSGAISEDRS